GVYEKYITGAASDQEKFKKWAETVHYTLRNPLYHCTHMELQCYFGIHDLLSAYNDDAVCESSSEDLANPNMSFHRILKQKKVKNICTTDDPIASLEFHQAYAKNPGKFDMFPAFRPDKAMSPENTEAFNQYVNKLA